LSTGDPLGHLVSELARLPGIGPKTATRLAHHLMRVPNEAARSLSEAFIEVKEKLRHCSTCNNITADDPCSICSDPDRDSTQICVVEEPFNIFPIERTGEYKGLYHALMGVLSPQRGIGPDQIEINSLVDRLDGVREVIVATNPNVEGEATAHYLSRLLRPRGVEVSRLAFGLPVGADLEFVDDVTQARSLAGRRAV
jgi:recombination protein RecR